ncbi:hypothetical protein BG000_002911 [Podila horticola]|nr:hypothetical protein BG000_002911 [Podila horticola]
MKILWPTPSKISSLQEKPSEVRLLHPKTTPTRTRILRTTSAQDTSPLSLPEILEAVLSYLDQETLRRCARLVSRQWFLVSSRFYAHVLVWDDNQNSHEDLAQILAMVPRAGNLRWSTYRNQKSFVLKDREWARLVAVVKKMDQHRKDQDLLLIVPLRELELTGALDVDDRIPLILPYMTSLRKLSLHLPESCRVNTSIEAILNGCATLAKLHIQGGHNPIHIFNSHPDGSSTWTLRSLTLRNVGFPQLDLESLLKRLPRLRELRIIDIFLASPPTSPRPYGPGDFISKREATYFNRNQFMDHVRSLGLGLTAFHLSTNDMYGTLSESSFQQLFKELAPTMTTFSLSTGDMTMPLIASLEMTNTRNVITTLELVRMAYNPELSNVLCQFLCNAPFLLHLKASRVMYYTQLMDLNGCDGPDGPESAEERLKPRIWACRGLQTLHLGFSKRRGYGTKMDIQSRIVFGYISRVCPRLRDVEIYVVRGTLAQEGGLCLLTRITGLERLLVEVEGYSEVGGEHDLDWVARSQLSNEPVPFWKRMKHRRHSMSVYSAMTIATAVGTSPIPSLRQAKLVSSSENLRKLDRMSSTGSNPQESTPITDPQRIEGLELVGLPEDLQGVLRGLNDAGFGHCWPELESIRIKCQHPDQAVMMSKRLQRLRPIEAKRGSCA